MEILKLIASIATPFAVMFLGLLFNRRLNKIERRHKSRIQFNIETNILGPPKGAVITEIIVVLENQGFTRHDIYMLKLSVLGIKKETGIEPFKKNYPTKYIDSIVDFPHELINTNMLARLRKKEGESNSERVLHFLEPGVIQRFTYVARIPEDIAYILVTAGFNYGENSKHTAKRVFAIKAEHAGKDKCQSS